MGPFSFKSVFLAPHAQHVVLIHFPIALFLIAVAFDVLGRLTHREAFQTVAFYNFVTAALFAVPVVITGLLAWRWALEGQRLKGILLLHLLLGSLSAFLIIATAWFHARARRRTGTASAFLIPLEFFAALVVAATGHLGGFLSGVNGPR